jgi:peptide/nickel transport system permease protein
MKLIEVSSEKRINDEKNNIQEEPLLSKIKSHIYNIITNSYIQHIAKKAIFYFVIFFIAISIAFIIPRLVPGNPLYYIYTPKGGVDKSAWLERIAELEEYLGLNKPLWEQYLNFLANFFQGNLGQSIWFSFRSVGDVVLPYVPYTLMLVLPVTIVTFILGNWIGGRVGYKKGKANKIGYYSMIALQSAPFFWFAYLFLAVFVLELGVIPYGTYPPSFSWNFGAIMGILAHYWIPFLTLTMCFTGGWATGMRSLMIYEKDSDYILYAQKLGFKEKKLRRYAMRNSILPQLTGLNLRFNEIMGATLIVEAIFQWPGLGHLIFLAFSKNDYNLIIGTFIFTIIIIVIGNFIIDILYGVIDPRIRIGGKEEK